MKSPLRSPLLGALRCEILKARRSRVPVLTALGFSLAPMMAGLFMMIMKDPDGARRMGLLRAKATMFAGAADWPTFLGVVTQAVAVGGSLLFALLVAWSFGREFADRTLKTVLAVPTSRSAIVLAKLLVMSGTALVICVWVFALALGVGLVVGLPGASKALFVAAAGRTLLTAALTVALLTPVAFIAGVGRGYMAPLGFAILTLFLGQIAAAIGWGAWFPWTVPALFSGLAGPEGSGLGAWSFALVLLVSAAGLGATLAWWRFADHTT
ncbi:MAG TPA: ABC transporter permease [Longimicrobiales bacterium]|nr:ABC transporter permease [Longimicrobiales bacterium]